MPIYWARRLHSQVSLLAKHQSLRCLRSPQDSCFQQEVEQEFRSKASTALPRHQNQFSRGCFCLQSVNSSIKKLAWGRLQSRDEKNYKANYDFLRFYYSIKISFQQQYCLVCQKLLNSIFLQSCLVSLNIQPKNYVSFVTPPLAELV